MRCAAAAALAVVLLLPAAPAQAADDCFGAAYKPKKIRKAAA